MTRTARRRAARDHRQPETADLRGRRRCLRHERWRAPSPCARQASQQKSLIIGRRLCGHGAAFGPPFTVLIDKIEKLRSCSCVAESAMMVFQLNVVSLAKIAKAVGLMAGITPPHSRAGAKLREAETPFETFVFV